MIYDNVIKKILNQNPDLCDWAFYEELGIYNPTTTAGYQHYLSQTWRHGMMYDFRDLRFFQSDGTELNYWIESKTDGSSASIWMKPERASQNRIYCFYGNPESTSRSSGTKTFEFFDDFLGSSLDTTKWTGSGSYSVNNAIQLGSGTDIGYISSSATFGTNLTLTIYAKIDAFASGTYQIGFVSGSYFVLILNSTSDFKPGQSDGTVVSGTEIGGRDAYHRYTITRNGSTSVIYQIDGTGTQTLSTHVPTGSLALREYGGGTSGKYTTIDWLHIRKFTATEPTVQVLSYGNRNPEYR